MSPAKRIRTTVQPGGKIEIEAPDLPVGSAVEVLVIPTPASIPRRPLREILARAKGHQSFRSAAEVDAYLQAERDSWDR